MSNIVTHVSAPTGIELQLVTLRNGLASAIPQETVLPMGQKTLSIADILATIDKLVAVFQAVRDLRASLAVAVDERHKQQPVALDLLAGLKASLAGFYGASSPELAKFGLAPRKKRAPLSSEARVQAAAKSKATRAKRHTLGKRQREALGSAPGQTVSVSPEGDISVSPADSPSAGGAASPSAGGSPATVTTK